MSQSLTSLARVVLPLPLRDSFVYGVPSHLREEVHAGSQVHVPFKSRELRGLVVELFEGEPPRGLRSIKAPAGEPVGDRVLELTRWVSDYYLAPWGEVFRAAVPKPLTRVRVPSREGGRSVPPEGTPALSPTSHQREVLETIDRRLDGGGFGVLLLQGVTGSGKTYVYCKAAAEVLRRGGGCLVLVPEISLSTQLVDRFREFFGEHVVLSHSGLSASERYVAWRKSASGDAKVVVGARSAVFSPLKNLALIIVDEEHEPSYKQSDVPRYNARDVAVKRGQLEGALVLLGSATPSLESYNNALAGKYTMLRLPCRVDSRPLARVQVVDLKAGPGPGSAEGGEDAPPARGSAANPGGSAGGVGEAEIDQERRAPSPEASWLFSDTLREKMDDRLAKGEQVILFINRRGHSTFVQCRDCGESFRCPRCEVTLTYHSDPHRLTCHYCGYSAKDIRTCAKCGGSNFWFGGVGTQKVEREIKRMFPEVGVLRMDVDSTRRRGSRRSMVETFSSGGALVLLGTQMVAKGFDFPGVTLVGVIYADTQLNLPDFRASERTFQLLTQVAGRAGRGRTPGEVVIQTFLPDHPSLLAAAAQDFSLFYGKEIEDRRELAFPPFSRLVDVSFTGREESEVILRANSVKTLVEGWLRKERIASVDAMGPAPFPIARLRNKARWHLTLRGRSLPELRRSVEMLRAAIESERASGVAVGIDVDPLQLM
jgi:primosomal protein N' (replication factor Y)